MTLLDRILARGVNQPADPIIAARVERHLRRIQPDPMFRRRLRGQVLNRYVANREGMIRLAPVHSGRREMGALGRGVLFASLLTALGVSAVGAAAQESLPGDALYPVKLQLEDLRMRVAPPELRDDLAAMALDERLEEVEALAAVGRWQLVDEAAEGAAHAEAQLAAMTNGRAGGAGASDGDKERKNHADRLVELLASAPTAAQDDLRRALLASTAEHPPAGTPPAVDPPAADPPHGGKPLTDSESPESPAEAPTGPTKHSPRVAD